MRHVAPLIAAMALACAACTPDPPPPPRIVAAGLPVSGDWPLARRKGFTNCFDVDAIHVRCRRHDIRLFGLGPYEAAVDLLGSDGRSGFDQLTLWHDKDQDAVYAIAAALKRRGWTYCYTGSDQAGDQAIFRHPGIPIRLSIDISYWGKRRIRMLPRWNRAGLGKPCTADDSLLRFGTDVAAAAGE